MNKQKDIRKFVLDITNLCQSNKDIVSGNAMCEHLIEITFIIALQRAPSHLEAFALITKSIAQTLEDYIDYEKDKD